MNLPSNTPNFNTGNPEPGMVLYDTMVSAIAECERVDEVKDIRDKAVALEVYYKQAKNRDAEIQACNIRLRAERRAGVLLKDLARATPKDKANKANSVLGRTSTPATNENSPYAEALQETGMSRQTAHQFQKLADVPEDEFEAALSGENKASRAQILNPTQADISSNSLWVWGRIKDFHRNGVLQNAPKKTVEDMTDPMRAETREFLPRVQAYLAEMEKYL